MGVGSYAAGEPHPLEVGMTHTTYSYSSPFQSPRIRL
jgi:hypothetical protein